MLLETPPVRLKNPPLARATLIPFTYKASKTCERIERYTALAGECINVRDGLRQAATIAAHKDIAAFQAEANPLPCTSHPVRCCWLRHTRAMQSAV